MKKKRNDELLQVVISSCWFREFSFCKSNDDAKNDCQAAWEDDFQNVEVRDYSWNGSAFEFILVLILRLWGISLIYIYFSYL